MAEENGACQPYSTEEEGEGMIYQFRIYRKITRCRECPCLKEKSIRCNLTDKDTTFYQRNDRKPSWCPLVKAGEDNE